MSNTFGQHGRVTINFGRFTVSLDPNFCYLDCEILGAWCGAFCSYPSFWALGDVVESPKNSMRHFNDTMECPKDSG